MKTYKTGQIVTIPANKAEGIIKRKAKVIELPDEDGIMYVSDLDNQEDGYPVAIDQKTQKILPDLIMDMY